MEINRIVCELLDLYEGLLLPFLKVRRDMPFPSERGRQETDGEHAFTVSVIAITVAERMGLALDTGLIAKYGLVHDLVEAYAGDVSVRNGGRAYEEKDAAELEALDKIKDKYADSAPWIPKYIEMYEEKADEESRFVNAIDKCMGALVRMADHGETWAEYYPEEDGSEFHRVVPRLRKKAASSPDGLLLFDAFYSELEKRWPLYLAKASE